MSRKGILAALIASIFLLSFVTSAQNKSPQKTDNNKKNDKDQAKAKSREQEVMNKALKKWLDEDVAYIITDDEKAAFKKLKTDEERESFIENFWLRRDPTPDTQENE